MHPLVYLVTLFTERISIDVRTDVLRAITDPTTTILSTIWSLCDDENCLFFIAGAAALQCSPGALCEEMQDVPGTNWTNVLLERISPALGLSRGQISRGVGDWDVLSSMQQERFLQIMRKHLVFLETQTAHILPMRTAVTNACTSQAFFFYAITKLSGCRDSNPN